MLSMHSIPILLILSLFLHLNAPISAFEGLLQAAGEVRKDRPAIPLRFASPDWNVYHRTHHLQSRLAALISTCKSATHLQVRAPSLTSQPQHLTVNNPSPSQHHDDDQSQSLRYITITHKPSPTELAGRIITRTPKTRAMFVFGETGRDFLTSEIALRVVEAACTPNSSSVLSSSLSHVELILVPIANPAGRRIAEMGRRCERTNANDVDLDANWPHFWNQPSRARQPLPPPPKHTTTTRAGALRDAGRVLGVSLSRRAAPRNQNRHQDSVTDTAHAPSVPHDDSPSFTAGTQPFSEPETRALRAIVEKLRPVSYVSVRTGAVAITIPWDCHPDDLPDAQRSRLLRVAEGITASHCTKCKSGNLWNVTGRTKCGTAADYMQSLKVPFVHTWHVYEFPNAANGDCFRRHNPTTKDGYERVVNNWAQAVFNFTTAVHNWMVLESSVGLDSAEQNASLSAAEAVARRADAMARGLPDPEKMEDDQTEEKRRRWGKGRNGAGEEIPGTAGKPSGKGGRLSWVFSESASDPSIKDNSQRSNDAVSNSKSGVGPQLDRDDDKDGLLTGWFGAFAALLLLAVGIAGVRRFIFSPHPKKSLFRTRRPVKNA